LAALFITSPQAGAGKTMLCAGLAKHLKGKGKKVGFFKPRVAVIKGEERQAADSDTAFIKRILGLKESVDELCPVISGKGDVAGKVRKAYDEVAKGKDIVIIEGIWRQRPGGGAIETAERLVKALEARVIVVEGYSPDLLKTKPVDSYKGFGESLLGVIINKVPASQMETARGLGGGVLGVVPEDRRLLSLTVAELAERIEGRIVNEAGKSAELVENYMLGALGVDSGLDYFGRKLAKAVVVRGERPDMQLAALETSTACLVISGDGEPIYNVLHSAEDKGIPIIITGDNTISVVESLEGALGSTKFNQEKKLPRLAAIMERQLDFESLYKGLGLAG
jgi:BioD-like phosphotransacetylase family protein